MTPLQFAKDECSDYLPNGACLGIPVRHLTDNNGPVKAAALKKCLVAEYAPCPYFEKCVLPLADCASPKNNPRLQRNRIQARLAYWAMVATPTTGIDGKPLMKRRGKGGRPNKPAARRGCPSCGAPLARGRRYCQRCARERKRTTWKEAYRRGRRTQQLLPENPSVSA